MHPAAGLPRRKPRGGPPLLRTRRIAPARPQAPGVSLLGRAWTLPERSARVRQGLTGVRTTNLSPATPAIFTVSATCPRLLKPTPNELPEPSPTLVIFPRSVI